MPILSDGQIDIEDRVRDLLFSLGVDLTDPNFIGTPRRVADHLIDIFEPLSDEWLVEMKEATFPSEYQGMVTACGIPCWGTCCHHLLPVQYVIHVAYISDGHVIGLSKLPRAAIRVAKLPILQEDVTTVLAGLLQKLLETDHVAVVVEGKHLCMSCRGVATPNVVVTSSEMRGFFEENNHGAKAEFFDIIQRSR